MSIVFVIDSDNNPLLPTHSARSRKLLREGKATVKQVVPFTIQLKRKVENIIGGFEVGVDDGAKYVGFAVKNQKTNKVVFRAELTHRLDVSRKVQQRKIYRRTRRSRLRNRQPRFNNRTKSSIPPSVRQRKECIIRVLKDLNKRLNINKVIVEEVKFNHFKYKYGRLFSYVEIGKSYLREEIIRLGYEYHTTFGYITKKSRLKLNLTKKHSNDACAIVESNQLIGLEYQIKPRRAKIWKSHPTRKHTEKNNYRHYDLVKSSHKNRGIVIGSIRTLKTNGMRIRTKFDNNFQVSYSKTRLLQRFKGLIYSY